MNNRTHRKLLIVDDEMGFTGGAGIADNWTGDATSPDHWRDSHHRLQGPVSAVSEQDLNQARRIAYEAWTARPWQERPVEHASARLSSQL